MGGWQGAEGEGGRRIIARARYGEQAGNEASY